MIITILAAGKGKRMRPITDSRLKGSIPIHNTPLLIHLANQLEQTGQMDKLVFVISPWQEQAMRKLFSSTSYAKKVFFAIQDPPKGTADAVAKAEPFIENEKLCLVLNGDINTDLVKAIPEIINHHSKLKAKCTILVFPGKGARYGLLQVTDDGRVLNIQEKVKTEELAGGIGYINAGVYLFDREIFDAIRKTPLSQRGEYEITDAISILGKDGTMGAVVTDKWMSFENPFDLFVAQSYFEVREELQCMQFHSGGEIGFKAAEGVYFDAETSTEFSSIKIKGPVLIGKGTLIETGSTIGPNVYLGENCEIGSNVQLSNTLLMNKCRIGAQSTINNFISAEEILIGKEVHINLNKTNPTNLNHFIVIGANSIIADKVRINESYKLKAGSVIKIESEIVSDYE